MQPKKFAPRPTYEHRAIFDRADDDLDDIEFRIGALPVDRLFDLREAFEGFVDQGSYIGVELRQTPSIAALLATVNEKYRVALPYSNLSEISFQRYHAEPRELRII